MYSNLDSVFFVLIMLLDEDCRSFFDPGVMPRKLFWYVDFKR